MFAKENRLTKDKEFDAVFKKGRSSYDKILGVKALKNDLSLNRFGILISVKVSKKAVERNKIRRQLRETTRQNLERIKKGMDVIVWAVLADEGRAVKEARVVMERVLSKANLITNIDKQAK